MKNDYADDDVDMNNNVIKHVMDNNTNINNTNNSNAKFLITNEELNEFNISDSDLYSIILDVLHKYLVFIYINMILLSKYYLFMLYKNINLIS